MASIVPILQDQQLRALSSAYRATSAKRSLIAMLGLLGLGICVALAAWVGEVDLVKLVSKIDRLPNYFWRTLHLDSPRPGELGALVFTDPVEWFWGLRRWLRLLGETLLMAYTGTLLGALGAFLLCFQATRNLSTGPIARFIVKRFFEVERTIPTIVFALIFVAAFGLGPLPGVLALVVHSMGSLGKQFYEIAENIDMKPVDGLRASGATGLQTIRFAALPQVLPGFASYGLLRFEINVREASIMGLVGAGGLGQDLMESIRKFYYSDVSALLILIVLTVTIIDLVTERIRSRLNDDEGSRT